VAYLEVTNLWKSFGGTESVLQGLDFVQERGEILCLLGASGCGKTTVLQILAGLMPDSVLLATSTGLAAPSVEAEEAFGAVRAIPGSVARLAIAQRVLLAQLSAACESLQQLARPHADAPLLRVLGFLLLDIRNDRERAELLLGLLRDAEAGQRLDKAVSEAADHFESAGGLVPLAALNGA